MPIYYEAGSTEKIKSLGGRFSRKGTGRKVESVAHTITAASQILGSNNDRISAQIGNADDSAIAFIYFGDSTLGGASFTIFPHGSFQIDDHFPWTGPVWVIGNTGSQVINTCEVSLAVSE